MGNIFVVMGKSASGKDSIYRKLLEVKFLNLKECIIYTTRPLRDGEVQGREYHFINDDEFHKMQKSGKMIEYRTYNTVFGPWNYATMDDGQFDGESDCIMIGTLESFARIRDYFGETRVHSVYIEVDDYTRLLRAVEREHSQDNPGYVEMCRRFIADSEDFSEDNIKKNGIKKRFINNSIDECVNEIAGYIGGARDGYKS